ncbi:endonuclease/exonuclease/phosphatase family protein [Pseudomonas syringae pv. actinidiae]|nr:endonuclease/exonuclease/phosphatase family protein [Pseudomonas syringae pv. actinidiae]
MFKIIAFAVFALFSSITLASSLEVGSWNMMRLGNGDQKNYAALAEVASKFDIFAVQEVMTQQGIDQLKSALQRKTGESWDSISSHQVGRHSYKEMYAFVWRKSAVSAEDGGVAYLDRSDTFEREPFSAQFKNNSTGQTFALSTVHIIYGKSEAVRTPEITKLRDYWTWLHEIYPGVPVILMGDFNMNPTEQAWGPLKEVAKPLLTSGASTLSIKDGKFSNLYDNFWVDKQATLALSNYGIVQYPAMIGWSHEQSRQQVSDHAPIHVTMGQGTRSTSASPQAALTPPVRASTAKSQQVASNTPTADVRGNQNSKIYHLPGCKSYSSISPKNIVHFSSEQSAQQAGYRIAGNCQ